MLRLTLLIVAAVPLFAHDWLIVPGERVGPITAASTDASLRVAFGSAAIERATIQIDETTSAPGAEIYRGSPGESLAVVWPRKERGLSWPLLIIPCYRMSMGADAECRWRTAGGVRLGLGLSELEKLNGAPFLLYSASDCKTWTEPWWNGGRLSAQLGEDIELHFEDPEDPDDRKVCAEGFTRSSEKPLSERRVRLKQLVVFLLSRQRIAPPNDWTIVPGQRIGPIPMDAAVEPLRETLGPAQVHRVLTFADEGMGDIPGISIFGDQKGRDVLLRRDGNLICVGIVGYKTCKWHIAGGIPFTATVEELERLNGRPFVFNGCCFDLGGYITSWEGGKLGKLERVRFLVDCKGDQPDRLIGEVPVRSDDPDIRRLACTASVTNF